MANVKFMPSNNSSSLFVNDASYPQLFGLDITEESPPKYDFDDILFTNDKKTHSKHQYFDIDKWKCTKSDSKTSEESSEYIPALSSLTENTASFNFTSRDTQPKNHFKKDKFLSELHFDGDLNLSDILGNVNPTDTNRKNTFPNNDALSSCLGVANNLTRFEVAFSAKKEAPTDDLLDLTTQNSISLEALATNHLSCSTEKAVNSLDIQAENHFEKDKFLSELHFDGDLNLSDILCNDKCHKEYSENEPGRKSLDLSVSKLRNIESDSQLSFCLDDFLSEGKYIVTETSEVELSSTDSSEIDDEKLKSSDDTSDGEILPDIDLSFCIKKNVKDRFTLYTVSPQSEDSGFEEIDLTVSIPLKSVSFRGISTSHDNCPFGDEKITNCKQSLFSRAISAKPKIDDIRKAKLNKVRNELLKKTIPLSMTDCKQQKYSQISERIIDSTNASVVMSSFLKVSN